MTWKKIIRNPYVVGIIASILGTTIWDIISNAKIWFSIGNSIGNAITWFFSVNLTIWIAIGILYLIVILMLRMSSISIRSLRKFINKNSNKQQNPLPNITRNIKYKPIEPKPLPEYTNYIQDIFFKLKWKWDWKKENDGKYYPEELRVICKKCDSMLNHLQNGKFRCVNADCELFVPVDGISNNWSKLQIGSADDNSSSIKTTIINRRDTGSYKDRLKETNQESNLK